MATTIWMPPDLKDEIDEHRAEGQAYYGFVKEVIQFWKNKKERQGSEQDRGKSQDRASPSPPEGGDSQVESNG